MGTDPEAITRDELTAAVTERLRRCGGTHLVVTGSPEVAAELFEVALSLREPEYEPGEIYESVGGYRYLRLPSASQYSCPWYVIHRGGRVESCPEDGPERPLRRLVPLPARDDLLAALEESLAREHGYDGQANRVIALLEGREVSDEH